MAPIRVGPGWFGRVFDAWFDRAAVGVASAGGAVSIRYMDDRDGIYIGEDLNQVVLL